MDRHDPTVTGIQEHPLVQLARRAVEAYVREHIVIEPPAVQSAEMAELAGVFVSIKKGDELRGCIGTFEPTQSSVAEEIIRNALSAALRDPRFPSVATRELALLRYSVDVLSQPELVTSLDELNPRRYGVLVVRGSRRGLLLPDLEGIDTAAQQLEIARSKAGIRANEAVEVLRFKVRRYT